MEFLGISSSTTSTECTLVSQDLNIHALLGTNSICLCGIVQTAHPDQTSKPTKLHKEGTGLVVIFQSNYSLLNKH